MSGAEPQIQSTIAPPHEIYTTCAGQGWTVVGWHRTGIETLYEVCPECENERGRQYPGSLP
jgi:hypothetical protein